MPRLRLEDDLGKFQPIYVNGISDGTDVLDLAGFKQVQDELAALKNDLTEIRKLMEDIPEKTPLPSNSGSAPVFFIELERWGIQQGVFGKPPYTAQQWEIAYHNLIGFSEALAEAHRMGISTAVVPRGKYTFCYTNLKGGGEIYQMAGTPITLFPNQTLDLNGSVFEVMYDSVNKNPYDKSPAATPAWKLSGELISIFNAPNAHVINGTIIGEIPNRSFSDGGTGFNSERGMEQTYGIKIDAGSNGASVQNVNLSMFMGDGIIIGSYGPVANRTIISGDQSKAKPGLVSQNGAIIPTAGAYVTDKFPLIREEHKEIQMRSGGGYTRIVPIQNHTFEYIFYNGETIVSRKKAVYLQTVTSPFNATHLRVQFINEKEGLTVLNNNFAITKPQIHTVGISKCIIHNNHRGGISGGADFTTIEKCRLFHNGEDSGLSIPVFPDTTRYEINFEDSYSNKLILKDNLFFSGFHGVLAGVHHFYASGNLFYNVNGFIIYNNANSVIENNEFYDSVPLQLMGSADTQNRHIVFAKNTAYASALPVNAAGKTYVKIIENNLYLDGLNLAGQIEFTGNFVKSYSGKYYTNYTNIRIDNITKCTDNTFSDFNYGSHYRLSIMKPRGSAAAIKNNIFRSCGFNSHHLANHIEFIASEFYDCIISAQTADPAASSSMLFDHCHIQDCQIALGGRYINNAKDGSIEINADFKHSKIIFTEAFKAKQFVSIEDNIPKAAYPDSIIPRTYGLNIEKSDVYYHGSALSPIYLIKYAPNTDADINLTKKVRIEHSHIHVADISKFKLYRSDLAAATLHAAVLIHNKYIGFEQFPIPKYGSLKTYIINYTLDSKQSTP